MTNESLPALPAFAREMTDRYFTSTVSQFVLHGAVRDLVPMAKDDGSPGYVPLEEYLHRTLFAQRGAVLFYDRSRGLTIPDAETSTEFQAFINAYEAAKNTRYANKPPADAGTSLRLVERFVRTRVADGKGCAFILDFADHLAPAAETAMLPDEDRNAIVTLLRWARDELFLRGDVTVVLITEQLADLNRRIAASPFTECVEVTLPDLAARLAFIRYECAGRDFSELCEFDDETLAKLASGLMLAHLRRILAEPLRLGRKLTMESLMAHKKELIEAECRGLVEFIEPKHRLDMVAGCREAKRALRQAAELLRRGRLDVLPMGYLICGPMGTGKTFLATSFAGEIGIPCVKILNIRSQWVGQTEANLQRLLAVFKALGPLGVIVDEADAFFGKRDAEGDAGTSSRVFSSFASFMSDTTQRGHIIWFLITARPDLLPIDLKRQGRAEEHIALFPPMGPDERREYFEVFLRKNEIETGVTPERLESVYLQAGAPRLTGADMEAVLIRAKGDAAVRAAKKSGRGRLRRRVPGFSAAGLRRGNGVSDAPRGHGMHRAAPDPRGVPGRAARENRRASP
ncbi:MAG: AAA family ATPase [Deltaproteobacteria bacterium]|nr:AAA family ATPase [Deltaproteobacteria bacterium]